MACNNRDEIIEIIERLSSNSQLGREIIILGGTGGCCESDTILIEAIRQNCVGTTIDFQSGSIPEVCVKIKPKHRTLLLGIKADQDGFFFSSQLSIENLRQMIESVFSGPKYLLNFTKFPKGVLFEIRLANQVSVSVVIVSSDIIDNLIPEYQLTALETIKAVIGGE